MKKIKDVIRKEENEECKKVIGRREKRKNEKQT